MLNKEKKEEVSANYLHVEGGHCFVCHKDYKGHSHSSPECVEKIIRSSEKIKYCGKFKGGECEFSSPESKLRGWEEELEEQGHAYQESFQPAEDGNHGYLWGKGYWEGIKFSKSLLSQELQMIREEVEDMFSVYPSGSIHDFEESEELVSKNRVLSLLDKRLSAKEK